MELDVFAPRRVLALTGSWIDPFRSELAIVLEALDGLVEGVGSDGTRPWVIAKHPMAKPETAFVQEVRAAFAWLGDPLPEAA